MILKEYQRRSINALEKFLTRLDEGKTLAEAYKICLSEQDINAESYQENISGVPQVCFKVPTGGGKTFMAAASLKPIHKYFSSRVIVWIVPSETILTQTYSNLNDTTHPYRQKIDTDFADGVRVYTKEQLLAGENFSPIEIENQLSILVLSYDSFRRKNKDGYKVFQENPHMEKFTAQVEDKNNLQDAAENSLINVLRAENPVIIVDESHHAVTDLSVEMLKNFNPSFILELTATPKRTSNVISYVPAKDLKAEGMIKVPVIVYNQKTAGDVIRMALSCRNALEKVGASENVRPIILFQAESKGKENRATFDKIKAHLIKKYDIPENQIAIKTATINDLKGVDLTAADCPIRYIITINALKEGWDCPFAYILASLANRTSSIDVEQILGRILRRPYTKNFKDSSLNLSYVFTASNDFRQTLDKVTVALNAAGFSENEYRAVKSFELEFENVDEPATAETLPADTDTPVDKSDDDFIDTETAGKDVAKDTEDLFSRAAQVEQDYDHKNKVGKSDVKTSPSVEVVDNSGVNEFPIQKMFEGVENFLLPQFFYKGESNLFETKPDVPISREFLYEKVTLRDKDTRIDFENLRSEIVAFDINGAENHMRYNYLSDRNKKAFMEHFDTLPSDGQIRQCASRIITIINQRRNIPSAKEIRDYVKRIVAAFDIERVRDAVQNSYAYARRIESKIDDLLSEYAKENFIEQIDSRQIFAKPTYQLPKTITPPKFKRDMSKMLYTAEADDMNKLEYDIISRVAALDNVRWWHRNRAKKEFCINGFITHYPDFIVMTNAGRLLLVEVKGDDRDNSDSERKLKLGKMWESKAGSDNFGYFMVFDKKSLDGAVNFSQFMDRIKAL